MGLFDMLGDLAKTIGQSSSGGGQSSRQPDGKVGAIGYGKQKSDGGHDHRTNTGDDRTPSQKNGDKSRRKS